MFKNNPVRPDPAVYRLAAKFIEEGKAWFATQAIGDAICQHLQLDTSEKINKNNASFTRYIRQYQAVFQDFASQPYAYWLFDEAGAKRQHATAAARGTRVLSLTLMADICEQGL